MTKLEVLEKVRQILHDRCDDPSAQIIAEGESLVAIGNALKGLDLHEARAVIQAAHDLEAA